MIQAIILLILFILFLLLTFPLVLIGFLVGGFSMKLRYKISHFIGVLAGTLLFIVTSSKVEVKGLENIPLNTGKGYLFVGNHKSAMDIPLLAKYIPFPIAFIAKASLKKVPFISQVMILMDCLFLQREDVRQAVEIIKAGVIKLQRGESLVIFPEGTRSRGEALLPFKQGSLKLAEKSNSPIIPFALKGTEDLYGKNGFKVKSARIQLSFAAPIYLDTLNDEDKKKSAQYVQQIVQQMYSEMG